MNTDTLKTFLIRLADLAEHAKSSHLGLPAKAADRQDKAAYGSASAVAGDHIRDPEASTDPVVNSTAEPLVPARDLATEAVITPRRSVRKVRSQLLIDPATWPHDAATFAALLAPDDLRTPFDLRPGARVVDATRFLAQLRRDIALGPQGPRARFGALQGDLMRLRDIAMAAADQRQPILR